MVAGATPSEAVEEVSVQVWLTPDLAGAAAYATAVATPGNPQFHRYLSPDAYTARFGPTAAQAAAVSKWLTGRGLSDVQIGKGRDYIAATGPESTVRSLRSRDDILGVTGLGSSGSAAVETAKRPTCSNHWAEHVQTIKPAFRGLTKGSLPICGYSARQLRAAYGASWAFTGKGQTVALTEALAPTNMFQALREYAKQNQLPAPKPSQYREITAGRPCARASLRSASRYDDEAEMDSEAVYAMAPHANQLMVVGAGCDEDQALLNAVHTVLVGDGHRPSASIISNSWQIPIGTVAPKIIRALTVRAAAEGVGLYFSSGDTPGVTATAQDPFVVAVGGTTLGLGKRGQRIFETGWSSASASLEDGKWNYTGISSGGGGTSEVDAQPAYQKGVVPPSMSHIRVGDKTLVNRAVPDIAAVGDPDTGMLVGHLEADDNGKLQYRTQSTAGTSLSAPLVAGLIAGAQQGKQTSYGFINPILYRLHGSRAFHDVLPLPASTPPQNRAAYIPPDDTYSAGFDVFDSYDPTQTTQRTAKGYDTSTGLGTPNGLAFTLALRRTSPVAK
ncbi:S8 family serine peptidase [Kribbella sandramycini]|nr:protease pro-enzyme activation domain-containing protein [Kribbella sandramycini]NOL43395.1 S8 family serine peptidase [Kribbella sandramycini]